MNSKTPSITKKQAERIFENEMITKDFWFVTEENDNITILQDVLDILYNVIEGNHYVAKYSKGQPYYSRLVIYCEVCRKELTSFDPFVNHDKGRPHKKALQVIISKNNFISNLSEDIVFIDPFLPTNNFEEGSLEDQIDHSKSIIIGLQFVYKERCQDELQFTCQLCAKDKNCTRIPSADMYSHLISDFHTLKYMNVMYGYEDCKAKDIQHKILGVVEREGKITSNIIQLEYDGNKQRCKMDDSSKRQRPRSQLPSSSTHKKRQKTSQSPEPEVPRVATSDQVCQANFTTESISEFVEQLKNCVEEENEISRLLQELGPEHQKILTNVVKVLGKGLLEFFTHNKDKEFEKMSLKFVEMTMKL